LNPEAQPSRSAPWDSDILASIGTLKGATCSRKFQWKLLDDRSVSEHHCQIGWSREGIMVRDLGSLHGTFVNGSRITRSTRAPGDELAVGMMTFLVEYHGEGWRPFSACADSGLA